MVSVLIVLRAQVPGVVSHRLSLVVSTPVTVMVRMHQEWVPRGQISVIPHHHGHSSRAPVLTHITGLNVVEEVASGQVAIGCQLMCVHAAWIAAIEERSVLFQGPDLARPLQMLIMYRRHQKLGVLKRILILTLKVATCLHYWTRVVSVVCARCTCVKIRN